MVVVMMSMRVCVCIRTQSLSFRTRGRSQRGMSSLSRSSFDQLDSVIHYPGREQGLYVLLDRLDASRQRHYKRVFDGSGDWPRQGSQRRVLEGCAQ